MPNDATLCLPTHRASASTIPIRPIVLLPFPALPTQAFLNVKTRLAPFPQSELFAQYANTVRSTALIQRVIVLRILLPVLLSFQESSMLTAATTIAMTRAILLAT